LINAPPFPPATNNERANVNTFNWWEKDILANTKLEVPVVELINVIRYHILIKPISAKLIAECVSEDIFRALFKHDKFCGVGFMCSDHDEVLFEDKFINKRPEGIHYYSFKTTLGPSEIHLFIKESKLTVLFDLAL
jgi:hypothetical protein